MPISQQHAPGLPEVSALPIKTALISVSDQSGLEELVQVLARMNVQIIATGGTAKYINDLGYWAMEVSDYTDFPEIMDGRVKTLHPRIHGGILANREQAKHRNSMSNHHIWAIDLVVINLYSFEQTIAGGCRESDAIEMIDIGGSAMLRGAAKNSRWVTVLSDPVQYGSFLRHLNGNAGGTDLEFRRRMAAKAFSLTARYDSMVASYLDCRGAGDHDMPETLITVLQKSSDLSYGENPHQKAAVYVESNTQDFSSLCTVAPLHGKPLSYNNLMDASTALSLASHFDEPAVVLVKHNTPCGVALGGDSIEAFRKALACDRLSAFGGVLALNRALSQEMVEAWGDLFLEVVLAPKVGSGVVSALRKRKNLRILEVPMIQHRALQYRSILGGMLLQTPDDVETPQREMQIVSEACPDSACWKDLLFAWEVVRHVKSNGVVFARDCATVGIGGGQTSRLHSVRGALEHSRDQVGTAGSVLASDAFFPFADAVEEAIKAGARAIIHPGGAMRDADVIEAANAHGVVMVHTGFRHFAH